MKVFLFLAALMFGSVQFSSPALAGSDLTPAQAKACASTAGDLAANHNQCNKDVDCGLEERCIGGECVPFSGGLNVAYNNVASNWMCNKDVDCGLEERCIGGSCVPFSGGGSVTASAHMCNKDVDCGLEERCIGGECVPFSGE